MAEPNGRLKPASYGEGKGLVMYECKFKNSHESQKKCTQYDKSYDGSRCMYLKFKRFCDYVEPYEKEDDE